MTELLIKMFVKNNSDTTNPSVRRAYGTMAGIVGIICNVFLFATKYIIGTISGSVAISADAVNNLSDASSNIITMIGFKLSSKKPDKDHPYGHGRYEYISGLCVCVIILSIGLSLARESLVKIIRPRVIIFNKALVLVLVISIIVKAWMMFFNTRIGKKIKSDTFKATAKDSRNDVISTTVVLISSIICNMTKIYRIDGIMGFLVAAFIIISGIDLVKETLSPLIGRVPDPEFVKNIADKVCAYEGVIGVHDLMIHDYGPGYCFVTIHVEFPADMDVVDAHDMVDNIEKDFINKEGIILTIHYDPVATGDERIDILKEHLREKIWQYDEDLSIHDLRIVAGKEHINVVFDCVIPPGYSGSIDELKKYLQKSAKEIDERYNTIIKIEQSYI